MGAAKFTFDTVFDDADDVVSDAARSRKRLSVTQGELDGMMSLARNEGMAASQVRAAEAIAHAARETVGAIDKALAHLAGEIENVRAQAVEVALAAARKLAHAALQSFPVAEVEATLRDAMHQAIGEPRIVLRAAPGVAEALAARVAQIAQEEGYDGRVQISAEPTLRNADCRIEWRGGGAERNEGAIEQAISALIARRFQDASRPMTEA
jgi:flagellar assembly protein FliH